jgi:endoglucanase
MSNASSDRRNGARSRACGAALLIAGAACSEGAARPGAEELPPGSAANEEPLVPLDEKLSFALEADAAGWVGSDTNALGLQGAWTTRVGTGSRIELRVEGSRVCMSGEAGQVMGMPPESTGYFGAAATFDFCRPPLDATEGPHALADCPWSPALERALVGVGFSVTATTLPPQIRVGFREAGRDDTPYVVVREAGEVVALFDEALVRNNPNAALPNPAQVSSLELLVNSGRQGPRPFDFCIENLSALAGPGWVSKEIPEWALEPGPGQRLDFVGVNLAGAEFGQQNLPGTYEMDYQYPGPGDIDPFVAAGMNVIRLPFRWERLQQSLLGELDTSEAERLDAAVSYATGQGLSVILDPHNYARYGVDEAIVGVGVPSAAFADFWSRVAARYAANEKVIFGLVNEPHTMVTETWLAAANAAIAAIRATGAANLILVPGNQWTGGHSWAATYYGTPNSVAMLGVVDPANNFAFEIHQYFDGDFSGTGATCVSPTIGAEMLQGVTTWLRDNSYRGFLAEFGGPPSDMCLQAIDRTIDFLGSNADVWMGWAAWAGGPRWGDYALSVQPLANGKDRPQLVVLRRHLTPPAP